MHYTDPFLSTFDDDGNFYDEDFYEEDFYDEDFYEEDFYEEDFDEVPFFPDRNVDVVPLIDVLLGTDDSIAVGLAQIGIDPYHLGREGVMNVLEQLERLGVVQDETGYWYREDHEEA